MTSPPSERISPTVVTPTQYGSTVLSVPNYQQDLYLKPNCMGFQCDRTFFCGAIAQRAVGNRLRVRNWVSS
ncbi:hypothetical protein [Argonema antarcticum]|uniref:hypothetical protein n=1 Tax=Argonema antarcticum TaxID=2942763 RepID=UPI0020127D18|nr:hypothetical protein [Argonema antarcticum]MCL1473605.1 hypothetical protein [Argonema antarcticum A004/B2]